MSGQTSFGSSFLSSRLFVNFTVWCRHSRVHSSVRTGTYFGGVGSQFSKNGTMIMCVKSLSSALALRFAAPFKKRLKCVEGTEGDWEEIWVQTLRENANLCPLSVLRPTGGIKI